MARLTPAQEAFLKEGHLATVATVRPDGSPHLTPVWVDSDGERVVFNTAEGRAKPRYIRRNAVVGVQVVDTNDPYRWISVTGPAEIVEDGAREHINELSHRYTGHDFSFSDGEKRLIVRIEPERVDARGV